MPGTGRRVTLADVAREAGVSIAAVSAVLTGVMGTVRVSATTRAGVLATAGRLGYTPNHVARSLRRRRTDRLTLLVFTLDNPCYADLAGAVRVAAAERGYVVDVVEARESASEVAQLEYLLGGGSDGVIVATIYHAPDDPALETLRTVTQQGIPAVLIDHSLAATIPALRIDDDAGAHLATTHLLQLGHQQIAYLANGTATQLDQEVAGRYRGYRRALADRQAAFDPAWVLPCDVTLAGGRAAVLALLGRRGPHPTALFCFNDYVAIAALRALYEASVRVPGELAVVGFDGIALGAFTTPALTTVAHSRADLGQLAVETLLALLEGAAPAMAERVLPCTLVVRESCGAAVLAGRTC